MVDIDANITNTHGGRPRDAILVAAVNPDGTPIGGGGTSGGATEATQLEVLMAVNEINTDQGRPSETPWTGTGDGTEIAVLKALYTQQSTMISLLQQIRDNTMAS